jgi:hypothetical protein
MKTLTRISMIALMLTATNVAWSNDDLSGETFDISAEDVAGEELTTEDAARFERDFRRGRWVCYARNRRGEVFRGMDRDRRWAETEALRECDRHSRFCRLDGCTRGR